MSPPNSIPIQCTLTPSELEKRRRTQLDALFDHATETKALENGRAFQFPGSPEMVVKLFEFIQAERQCCAFFQFELTFAPEMGPIWLKLTGGEGVKAFIESEMM